MLKILINQSYGGFDLPGEFYEALEKKHPSAYKKYVRAHKNGKGEIEYSFKEDSLAARTDENVVSLFEKLFPDDGDAETSVGNVVVVEINDDRHPNWWVEEYDGFESVELEPPENHGFAE